MRGHGPSAARSSRGHAMHRPTNLTPSTLELCRASPARKTTPCPVVPTRPQPPVRLRHAPNPDVNTQSPPFAQTGPAAICGPDSFRSLKSDIEATGLEYSLLYTPSTHAAIGHNPPRSYSSRDTRPRREFHFSAQSRMDDRCNSASVAP